LSITSTSISPLPLSRHPLKIQYRRMLKEKYRKPALYPVLDSIILIVSKPPSIGRLHAHSLKVVQQLIKQFLAHAYIVARLL
jgi:hypothetical protein